MKNANTIICIVDDDEDDAFFLRMAFEKVVKKENLRYFRNGKEFINHISVEKNKEPWLVMLDLNMPVMNGADTLRTLKDNPELAPVPVIMFTTSSNQKDVKTCYDLGANSYICKPSSGSDFDKIVTLIKNYWLDTAMLIN